MSIRQLGRGAAIVVAFVMTVGALLALGPQGSQPDYRHRPLAARPLALTAASTSAQPSVIYSENFETNVGTAPVSILSYTPPTGVTYTAASPTGFGSNGRPGWVPASSIYQSGCNGWIAQVNSTTPSTSVDPTCAGGSADAATGNTSTDKNTYQDRYSRAFPYLRAIAEVLGQAEGQGVTNTNHALSAYTNNPFGVNGGYYQNAGIQFDTSRTIPVKQGHYYEASVWYGAINCSVSGAVHPLEQFNFTYGTTPTLMPLGGQTDVCAAATAAGDKAPTATGPGIYKNLGTQVSQNGSNLTIADPDAPSTWPTTATLNNTGTGGIAVAHVYSAAITMPAGVSQVGIRVLNQQANGEGNDGEFDQPSLVDATPTIDKSFSPALVEPGQTSVLTWTITNTADLMEKDDWSFTDQLPAGLTLANTTFGGSCANVAGAAYSKTGTTGGSTVTVTGGDLAANQSACTITANVTSTTEATYTNDPRATADGGNMTSEFGLLPGAAGTVQFLWPRINVTKALSSSRISGGNHTGDQFTVALRTGSGTGAIVSTQTNATTTGTGSTVTAGTGTTGTYVATATQTYYPTESAAGTTDLSLYSATLTCTDSTGRTTGLPTNAAYTGSNAITPAAGANITCTITNAAKPPTLTLTKVLGNPRNVDTDQFTMQIRTGSATGTIVGTTANATSSGTGSTVTSGTGTTTLSPGVAGTTYYLTETGAGTPTANLANYAAYVTCTDASGLTAGLPTNAPLGSGYALPPAVAGAQVSCTISNSAYTHTLTLKKNITARVNAADQFSLNVATQAAPATSLASATTTGTSTGVQATAAGPVTAAASTAYLLTETGSGGADLSKYVDTIACTNTVNGTTTNLTATRTAAGSYQLTYPALTVGASDAVVCTITNAPAPNLNVTKSVTSVTMGGSGVATAKYTVSVINSGAGAGSYGPLTDTPSFGSGLTVTGATWTATGGPAGGSATGTGPYTLTPAGTAIPANSTQTFTVAVTFKITGTVAGTCSGAGTATYNAVALPAGQENGTAVDNAACGPLRPVQVLKTDLAGTGLDGAQWQLSADDGSGHAGAAIGVPAAPVSGTTGLAEFDSLPAGTYWLTETKAPAGYALQAQAIQFAIAADGTVTQGTSTSSGKATITTATVAGTTVYRLAVVDYRALTLPFAGGHTTRLYVFAGGLLVLLAALTGLVGPRRRRAAKGARKWVRTVR